MEFRHPSASRLVNGHYRWVNLNKGHTRLKIKENPRFIAPAIMVPKPGYRVNIVWLQIWYEGSDLEKPADEYYGFPHSPFAEAFEYASAEAASIRQSARLSQCDPSKFTGCFLTTAAVGMLGLPDDCWELEQLRSFRDGWLEQQSGGAEQIADYYERAPAIADKLQSNPKRLARLYLSKILPAAIAAKLGFNGLARWLYSRMMRQVSDLG